MNPRNEIVEKIYQLIRADLIAQKLVLRVEKSNININDESQLPAVSISINKENIDRVMDIRGVDEFVPQSSELFIIIRILTNGDNAEQKSAVIQSRFESVLFKQIANNLLLNDADKNYRIGKFRLNEFQVETDKSAYLAVYDVSIVYHSEF